MNPPWWRPFARRRWRKEQAKRPAITLAQLDEAIRKWVDSEIVPHANDESAVFRFVRDAAREPGGGE